VKLTRTASPSTARSGIGIGLPSAAAASRRPTCSLSGGCRLSRWPTSSVGISAALASAATARRSCSRTSAQPAATGFSATVS
jgi:hypothetical protein